MIATPVPALPATGTFGLIAPAGPVALDVDLAQRWFAERGHGLKLFPGVLEKQGYLAGSDQRRLDDLHGVFADPDVDAVICLRGGFGVMRLLDRVDFDLLRANPKPFVGYSDLTSLHLAIAREAGFVTFHGPMLTGDLLKGKHAPTERSFFDMLYGKVGAGTAIEHPSQWPLATVLPGRASGRLVGGNLTLLTASLATPWELDTRDSILLIEDINEPLYRIDRLLTHLHLAGKLEGVQGVLAGDFAGVDQDAIDALLHERFAPYGVPVLSRWRTGHCDPNITLPLGARVELDADQQSLVIAQAVTCAVGEHA